MNTVTIDTPAFKAVAMFIGEMPNGVVIEMMSESDPAKQLIQLVKILKDAILKGDSADRLDGLSFDELLAVVRQYADNKPVRTDLIDLAGDTSE